MLQRSEPIFAFYILGQYTGSNVRSIEFYYYSYLLRRLIAFWWIYFIHLHFGSSTFTSITDRCVLECGNSAWTDFGEFKLEFDFEQQPYAMDVQQAAYRNPSFLWFFSWVFLMSQRKSKYFWCFSIRARFGRLINVSSQMLERRSNENVSSAFSPPPALPHSASDFFPYPFESKYCDVGVEASVINFKSKRIR